MLRLWHKPHPWGVEEISLCEVFVSFQHHLRFLAGTERFPTWPKRVTKQGKLLTFKNGWVGSDTFITYMCCLHFLYPKFALTLWLISQYDRQVLTGIHKNPLCPCCGKWPIAMGRMGEIQLFSPRVELHCSLLELGVSYFKVKKRPVGVPLVSFGRNHFTHYKKTSFTVS